MKKISLMLGALVLAVVGLVGCSKAPTAEEYAKWATDNGYALKTDYADYTKNSEIDYTGWATTNGYTKQAALPAARVATLDAAADEYSTTNSGVLLVPGTGSKAVSLIDYLDRDDAVYIDARDIGNYLNGHVEGFENLPFFDLIAGTHKEGENTVANLYTVNADKTVKANYEESKIMLNKLIPTDKALFLMCQSGGRIVNFMKVLKFAGYDMTKVYNVGGYGNAANVTAMKTAGYGISESGLAAAGNDKFVLNFSALTPVA